MILKLSGSLDAHTVNQLEETLAQCVAQGQVWLIFDLGGLDYVSSAGMGLLIGRLDEVRAKGGDLVVAAARPNVHKVFQILGFDKIFRLFHDVEAAVVAGGKP